MRLLALLSASVAGLFAQSDAGPRCEPVPELRKLIFEISQDSTRPAPARFEWQASEWERLIEQHPREPALHRRYYLLFRDFLPDRVEPLRQRYLRQAEERADDALAALMAGLVLEGVDTPKAIATLERAVRLDPGFGRGHLQLASLYRRGKFQDKDKAAEHVAAYYRACPENVEEFSLSMLNHHGTAETIAAAAKAIRARLETETDPEILRSYSALWGLEFKATPVAEHPKQRERVAADLRRLERLNRKPDAAWLKFLGDAMKQCGRDAETTEVEARILREFPTSREALGIVVGRWEKAHPAPAHSDPAKAWDEYAAAHTAAVEGWSKQFPDSETMWISMRLDEASEPGRVRALGEQMLAATDRDNGVRSWPRIAIPWRAYLRFGMDPRRAAELLESARPLLVKEQALQLQRDDLTDNDRKALVEWQRETELTWAFALATAYRRSGSGERAASLRPTAEGIDAPTQELKAMRFAALAEIAAAQGKHADALALYRAALDIRPKAPPLYRGRSDDRILDGAREVWKLAGGSDGLWALWSKPPERAAREITDSRWEQPRKPLPAFDLPDVGGRAWSSKALAGKTLVINVWATWCGPCMADLPHFQKLYERTKERDDIAVLSLNIDDEVGLVEPFMKGKGLTFPALLAASYVNRTLETVGVPQTWIVDRSGQWIWQQVGYDGAADWERSILEKIDAAK